MVRNLYRFYLYTVFIALLIFAVVVTSQLLTTLFEFTALRGSYSSISTQPMLVQSIVLAVVGWIIAGTLGGLHYWLIRRDMHNDPAARMSAIRAFFLNITEAMGVVFAVPLMGFWVISSRIASVDSDVTLSLAISLSTLAMVGLLELERRRTPEQRGLAIVFQRLHFFGVQIILLLFLFPAFFPYLRILVDKVFFAGRGECSPSNCSFLNYNLWLLVLALLWFSGWWMVYALTGRRDTSRLVRMLVHGAGVALGIGFLLAGLVLALELLLLPAFHISVSLADVLSSSAGYDFITPFMLGLLVAGVYHMLLRDLSRRGLIETVGRRLTEQAIAGIVMAGAFWIGCAWVIYNTLQAIVPSPTGPDSRAWVMSIALVMIGLAYTVIDLYLRRSYARDAVQTMGPRRGFVLALLGGGILALAIGGAIALYNWGTFLLKAPVGNWTQGMHVGLAAAIVGAIIVVIYLWSALNEHLILRPVRTDRPSDPVPPVIPTTIEGVLDDLLAGHITRDEAVAIIQLVAHRSEAIPVTGE